MPFDATPTPDNHIWAREHLSPKELEALLRVRDDLTSGVIPPECFCILYFDDYSPHCGTKHCIGGWMAKYLKINQNESGVFYTDPRFSILFFGFPSTHASCPILPTDAVEAINQFLSTGIAWSTPQKPSDAT